jgi:hypothetical protein
MIANSISLLFASIMASVLSAVCSASDSDAASNRYFALKQLTARVKATSTPQEVWSLLGDPIHKGTGGWGHLDREVWSYLDYTDESQSFSFSVTFDPKMGCSVSASQTLRSEVMKHPKQVAMGTVRAVNWDYPTKGGNGFLCDVQFDDGPLIGVAVSDRRRVKGEPEREARVRVEHYGPVGQYIFVGGNSLFLESMEFTRATPIHEPVKSRDH